MYARYIQYIECLYSFDVKIFNKIFLMFQSNTRIVIVVMGHLVVWATYLLTSPRCAPNLCHCPTVHHRPLIIVTPIIIPIFSSS